MHSLVAASKTRYRPDYSAAGAIQAQSVPSVQALDQPHVAHGAVAEHAQGFLIAGAIMRGFCLFETVEFGNDDPLLLAVLKSDRRGPAHDVTAAHRLDGGPGDLGVSGEFVRILDLTVA